jgi:hypothetical protein
MHCPTRHQITMMSGQFHVPAASPPVPILYEARCALVRSRSNGGEAVSALAKIVTLFLQDYSHPLCLLRYPGLTYSEAVFMV